MANSLKTALRQIRRTPYQALAAIMVLTLTFFAASVFTFLFASANIILKHFESAPQVIAFFEKGKDLSDTEVATIKAKLSQTGNLASFKYVSTHEAEQIYKEKNKDDPILLELVDYKILPPSIEVSANNIEALKDLKEILKSQTKAADVIFYEDVVQTLATWFKNIRLLGIALVIYLTLQSFLILVLIVSLKILSKKEEIEIMRLLGASFWFIVGPFLFEGVIYGIIGAILGFCGALSILLYSTPLLVDWLADIPLFPISPLFLLSVFTVQILAGIFIGIFSSLFSVRRFLPD